MRTCALLMWLSLQVIADAATYSTPISEFTVDASGNFSTASFDFGFSFAQIEGVSLEIVLDQTLPVGVCGSSCHSVLTTLAIFDPLTSINIDDLFPNLVHDNSLILGVSLGGAMADEPSQMRLLAPSTRIDLETGMFSSDPWPQFLFDGKGSAAALQLELHSCYLNCSGSSQTASAMTAISSARVIVDGVATPEPATAALAAIAFVGACAMCRHKRTI